MSANEPPLSTKTSVNVKDTPQKTPGKRSRHWKESTHPDLMTLSNWKPGKGQSRDTERALQRPRLAVTGMKMSRHQSALRKSSSFNGRQEESVGASVTSKSFDGHTGPKAHAKARSPPKISPPARKRVRLSPSPSSVPKLALGASTSGDIRKAKLAVPSITDRTSIANTGRSDRDRSRGDDDEMSTSSGPPRSDVFGTGHASSKICYSCKKPRGKDHYGPLVKCPTCTRRFHSGHRDPKLAEGQDSETWRCHRCIVKKRKPAVSLDEVLSQRTSSGPSPAVGHGYTDSKRSTPASTSSSVPIRLHGGPLLTNRVQADTVYYEGLADPGSYNDIAQRFGLAAASNTAGEPRRTEIPNTPTQSSSQIPNESPVRENQEPSLSLKSPQPHVNMRGSRVQRHSATVKCLQCHRGPRGSNSICIECQGKVQDNDASMVSISIPETPDVTSTAQKKASKPQMARRDIVASLDITSSELSSSHRKKSAPPQSLEAAGISTFVHTGAHRSGTDRHGAIGVSSSSTHLDDVGTRTPTTRPIPPPIRTNGNEPESPATPDIDTPDTVDDNSKTVHIPLHGSASDVVLSQKLPKSPEQHLGDGPRDYSFRGTIGLALAASDPSPLTVADMTAWIASHFPDKAKSLVQLQRNISAVASNNKAEFRGERVVGERSNSYRFANSKTRQRYMKTYQSFKSQASTPAEARSPSGLNTSFGVVPTNQPSASFTSKANDINKLPDLAKSLKASLSIPNLPTRTATLIQEAIKSLEDQTVETSPQQPSTTQKPWFDLSPEELQEQYGSQPTEQQPEIDLSDYQILDYFPEFVSFSDVTSREDISAMSREEIEAKKEEIKKRPTRKQMFGKMMIDLKDAELPDAELSEPVQNPEGQSSGKRKKKRRRVVDCGSVIEDGQEVMVTMELPSSDGD